MPESTATRAVKYPPHSPLRAALNQRVQGYFKERGIGSTGGPRMWLKTATIISWFVMSYVGLVFWANTWWQAVPLAISLGLSVAGVGFNIQHDGGHGAYARRKLGNKLSSWALDVVGGSSYFWHFKHNLIHHHYTNIEGVDSDIDAEPVLRLAPGQRRFWFHRFQHLYVWFFYMFFPMKWALRDDFRDLAFGRIGTQTIPRPRGAELVMFFVGKAAYLSWALIIPLIFHPWAHVLVFYSLYSLALGVTLATVFQLAHCVREAHFADIPEGDSRMEMGWAEHQLATTVDFSPRSRFLAWYLGGLNYQVEHHLFPRISHIHYPALAPITREVCREFGVEHLRHETLWSALRSHVGLMRDLGRRPAPADEPCGSATC